MFEEYEPQHMYDTRHRCNTRSESTRKTSSKCIRYHLPILIEKTPDLVTNKTETHSPKGFSNYAKRYYLDLYKIECIVENCYVCK